MFQENNEVDNSAETTTQDDLEVNETSNDTDSEDEGTQSTEGSKQQSDSKRTETDDQRRARIKRQYEREFGKEGDKGSQESGKEGDERYQRLELKTEGVTSKKAQDVVLEYAKFKGIDPIDALKSPIVKAEIAELEKKTSAPAPSKRTSIGASDSFEYWVGQARKGNFPRGDKAMMDKLKKARIFTS